MREDPRSAEIIKPVLRGRDIRRYRAKWAGLWLIATFPALGINIDNYPAVKRHLLSFGKARLEQFGKILPDGTTSRKKTVYSWYELQDTCAYHAAFRHEKLLWMDMSNEGRFAYSNTEIYCNDKGFIMTGTALKFLCGILNSALITWVMRKNALTTGLGLIQWKKFAVERLSIPHITVREQRTFIDFVERLRTDDRFATSFDPHGVEVELNQRVYSLYSLTPSEIAAVERH